MKTGYNFSYMSSAAAVIFGVCLSARDGLSGNWVKKEKLDKLDKIYWLCRKFMLRFGEMT